MKALTPFVLLAYFFVAQNSFAQNGTKDQANNPDQQPGTGVYTNRNGKKELHIRDILDETSCDYRSLNSLLNEFGLDAKVDAILSALFKMHPFMAYKIRKDLDAIRWCLTQNLKFVPSDDSDAVTESYLTQVQVAIRRVSTKVVYIDVLRLKQMPDEDKALTLIHESMHTFLPLDLPTRNTNLRTVTRAIYQNYIDLTKGTKRSISELKDNFDVMLAASGATPAFHTIKWSNLFKKAVQNGGQVTTKELWSLININNGAGSPAQTFTPFAPTENDALINDESRTGLASLLHVLGTQMGSYRLAGLAMQQNVDAPLYYQNSDSKGFFWEVLPLFGEVTHMRGVAKSNFSEHGEYFGRTNLNGAYSKANSTNIGGCKLSKPETKIEVSSAGFMSSVGFTLRPKLEFSLTRDGRTLYRISKSATVRQRSILIDIKLGDSLIEKLEPFFADYEQSIRKAGRIIQAGHCDVSDAPDLKFFR